ncbi:hypothetical protein V6N12_028309 [Hibiscus sabdariffa]|uniref:Uncharacterized protein n=1 Tax=Hibiscus sabdariffa TaxID=183260 RepID=A0ABR2F5I7_9ROSI
MLPFNSFHEKISLLDGTIWEFMRKPFNCCLSAMLECSESELLVGAACIVEQKAICSGTELTSCFLCTMRSGKLKAAKLGINCRYL